MKPHQIISYGLMTAGSLMAAQSLQKRQRWEQANNHALIMLDWDDVQAVATRVLVVSSPPQDVVSLLQQYKENGATHLSIPELNLDRLLAKGQLSLTQGSSSQRVYLQTKSAALADLLVTELQARLPHIDTQRSKGCSPLISFIGDLPAVAEMGLGFDPAHATLAQEAGLSPVARPLGYSWVQPEMIERTFNQAAILGCEIIAVQGNLIPGHEFEIQHTVEAMQRQRLTYAYFREMRHQKGDWFLAKHLASAGLVMLAHEFTPTELLDEDWNTAAYRWANLALEAGVRLCSVRFFKILHAADPLESVAYIRELSRALQGVGLATHSSNPVDLATIQPTSDPFVLAGVGISTAGAAGLATDLLSIPDSMKLLSLALKAVILGGLPFMGSLWQRITSNHHHHNHEHDHHHDHDDHHHHHDHEHGHTHSSHGPAPAATAYAQKGLALAATVAYPAAVLTTHGASPWGALAQTTVVTVAGATAVAATTVDRDYLFGIEEYRGHNLDWLIPFGLIGLSTLLPPSRPKPYGCLQRSPLAHFNRKSKIQNPKSNWLPLAGVAAAALANLIGKLPFDLPATLDREHRHAHTHHLSAFQQQVGDMKLAISPKPLRKWSLLAPAGVVCAAIFKHNKQDKLANAALMVTAAGEVATLAGFRQGQRPLEKTVEGRAKGWAIGAVLAGVIWLLSLVLFRKK